MSLYAESFGFMERTVRTYQDTHVDRITRERDIAFDAARAIVWRARYYSGEPCSADEIRRAVRQARGLQWNAASIFRFEMRIAMSAAA